MSSISKSDKVYYIIFKALSHHTKRPIYITDTFEQAKTMALPHSKVEFDSVYYIERVSCYCDTEFTWRVKDGVCTEATVVEDDRLFDISYNRLNVHI